MIRLALFCGLMLAVSYAAADDKKDVSPELKAFQGTWKTVKVEEGGKEPSSGFPEAKFTFTDNKFSVKVGKEPAQEGTISVDPKKDPTELDIVGGPKKEKTLAIYKFDKDGKLTISFISKPNATRPKKFNEAETIMIVLEKVKE
jgi:uncharacterized protein (TIGR03067 family)